MIIEKRLMYLNEHDNETPYNGSYCNFNTGNYSIKMNYEKNISKILRDHRTFFKGWCHRFQITLYIYKRGFIYKDFIVSKVLTLLHVHMFA